MVKVHSYCPCVIIMIANESEREKLTRRTEENRESVNSEYLVKILLELHFWEEKRETLD